MQNLIKFGQNYRKEKIGENYGKIKGIFHKKHFKPKFNQNFQNAKH